MANEYSIISKKKNFLTNIKFISLLDEINKKEFGGLLPIKTYPQDGYTTIAIEFGKLDVIHFYFEEKYYEKCIDVDKNDEPIWETYPSNFLTLRHPHGVDFITWLGFYLFQTMANTLKCEIDGEGFYEAARPYKTRKFPEWIKRRYPKFIFRKLSRSRKYLKYEKKVIGKKLIELTLKTKS